MITRRDPVTLVELCAGSAAVSLRYLRAKAKPPIAYQGSKRAYADSILDALGLAPGGFRDGDRIVLVELGPWADAYSLWRTREGREHTIARLREWSADDPRALWERLADVPPPDAVEERIAAWCVLQWWAFGGKVVHAARGRWNARAAGFSAGAAYATRLAAERGWSKGFGSDKREIALPDLAERIAVLPDLAAVEVRRCDVRDVLPIRDVRVVFDPPYRATTGYGHTLPRADVLAVATRWGRVAGRVAVCESEPLPLVGWSARPSRKGIGTMGGRTFSAQQSEYLTLSAPAARATRPRHLKGPPMRLALLLALASLPARAQHLATGIAAELYAPPAPVEDPGRVVAQAAPQPAIAPAPMVPQASETSAIAPGTAPPVAAPSLAVPPVALDPLAPLVPAACVPTGKPFPVWLTVTLAIAGAAVSTLEALHSTGVVGK